MEFHQYFLCKSRYWRLLSPCAAPAQCAKHFIFKAPRVNHLVNSPIPPVSLFSLCGIPVVLNCLLQMTLKAFPMHSELTQLHVDAAPFAKVPKGNEGGSSSHPGGFPETVPLQPAVKFHALLPPLQFISPEFCKETRTTESIPKWSSVLHPVYFKLPPLLWQITAVWLQSRYQGLVTLQDGTWHSRANTCFCYMSMSLIKWLTGLICPFVKTRRSWI